MLNRGGGISNVKGSGWFVLTKVVRIEIVLTIFSPLPSETQVSKRWWTVSTKDFL